MLINGSCSKSKSDNTYSQAVLSISQLIAYHCKSKALSDPSSIGRNKKNKETPLPLFEFESSF